MNKKSIKLIKLLNKKFASLLEYNIIEKKYDHSHDNKDSSFTKYINFDPIIRYFYFTTFEGDLIKITLEDNHYTMMYESIKSNKITVVVGYKDIKKHIKQNF